MQFYKQGDSHYFNLHGKRPLFGLQVECRLEHYASCHFLGSLGLGLPTQYACRHIWPSRRNGEEVSPFRDLLPLDTEINFTNALCRCTQMSRQENIDATWQHRPGSALAQTMACCLMAPSHYLNQRWLNVKGVGGIQLTAISSDMLMHLIGVKCLRRLHFKITAISPKVRWVNKLHWYLIGSTCISTRKMPLIKFSVK